MVVARSSHSCRESRKESAGAGHIRVWAAPTPEQKVQERYATALRSNQKEPGGSPCKTSFCNSPFRISLGAEMSVSHRIPFLRVGPWMSVWPLRSGSRGVRLRTLVDLCDSTRLEPVKVIASDPPARVQMTRSRRLWLLSVACGLLGRMTMKTRDSSLGVIQLTELEEIA